LRSPLRSHLTLLAPARHGAARRAAPKRPHFEAEQDSKKADRRTPASEGDKKGEGLSIAALWVLHRAHIHQLWMPSVVDAAQESARRTIGDDHI
jgi:hypothetical protein